MSAQFNIRRASSRMVSVLQRELDLPRFVAATLVGRGIDTPKAARAFLFPSFKHDWLDPYRSLGTGDVVDALEDAVRKGRRIVVFGDFDLDGISATTVLTRGLRELGADTVPFIPKRFEEGYGITAAALERVKTYGPDFLVAVDCGIACKAEVKLVQAAGINVAITDHHGSHGPGSRGRARRRPEGRRHVPKLRARRCGRGAEARAGARCSLRQALPLARFR